MTRIQWACSGVAFACLAVAGLALPSFLETTPAVAQPAAVQVKADSIGGTVTGTNGPEAGVWVIAETKDLPTKYVKIVVTDDQGRYLVPDLPKAKYDVWVRGYGLVDLPRSKASPGDHLDLKSVQAPSEAAAAEYYPAMYWYSMLHIPEKGKFPGTGMGPGGNGMSTAIKTQDQWIAYTKTEACQSCHQIGDKATRVLEPQLGHFNTSAEAWERRIQSGQASEDMVTNIGHFSDAVTLAFKEWGDWTDRVAKGQLPKAKPPRPQGIERNVVITEWDWGTPTSYQHDEIATDRRNPTLNANGIIYGSPAQSSDYIPWLDPVHNKSGLLKSVWRDPNLSSTASDPMYAELPYWGKQVIWDSHTYIHNPMLDERGRLWLTARIRPAKNPAFCRAGSNHPSAKVFPLDRSGRQVEFYDPKTKKFTMIDLCFNTHHLFFDKNEVLWFSAGGVRNDNIGWLDVKKFDATGDEQASQGWSPFVLDTNGNGKRDEWTEPGKPMDPTKDMRVITGTYGVAPNPVDGSVWGSVQGMPGGVVRFDPKTQLTEFYEVPWHDDRTTQTGFGPRGDSITTDGVVWVTLVSGHLASFDRSKCKGPLNGPKATGKQCPEGWTLYEMPAPHFENVANVSGASASASYFPWVDQFNTFGLGNNTPVATGNNADSLEVLHDGKFVTLRVPYPIGFYTKGLDGRIDDPNGGWKGRGLYSVFGTVPIWHMEGGKGQSSKVVHFQMRPNPLAD